MAKPPPGVRSMCFLCASFNFFCPNLLHIFFVVASIICGQFLLQINQSSDDYDYVTSAVRQLLYKNNIDFVTLQGIVAYFRCLEPEQKVVRDMNLPPLSLSCEPEYRLLLNQSHNRKAGSKVSNVHSTLIGILVTQKH